MITPSHNPVSFLSALLLILITLPSTSTHAQLRQSQHDPRNLTHHTDPQYLYFHPGDHASHLFHDPPTQPHGNLRPWQDEYTNTFRTTLDSPQHHLRFFSDDPTSRTAYWEALHGQLYNNYLLGTTTAWIINDTFMQTLATHPHALHQFATHTLALKTQHLIPDAIIFDLTTWTPQNLHLKRQLAHALPQHTFAIHIRPTSLSTAPRRNNTFIIMDEESIPISWRHQAAVPWVQHRYGQVPVIISPQTPDFQRDLIWLTTGASGICYRPIPTPDTPTQHHAAAIHLRATTTFLNRFGNHRLWLTPRPIHSAHNFTLHAPGHHLAAILPSNTTPHTISLPLELQNTTIGTAWFNPATDENIIQPLTQTTTTCPIEPPDEKLWVHSISKSTTPAETRTTVTTIRTFSDYW